MKRILTEPLVHFLLIGALLFLGFSVFRASDESMDTTIVVTDNDIKVLKADFERTWQRPPREAELEGLLEEKIREEIAYREGLALGLDRDDPYIRRRLRMKLELLLEDISAQASPGDEELQKFLEENREKFRQEPRYSLYQVYLNPSQRKETLQKDAEELLQRLKKGGDEVDPGQIGDSIMLPRAFPLSPATVINRQFGSDFTTQLSDLETGTWQGPIRSGYGIHLVLINQRIEGRDPDLAEIRPMVEREYELIMRKELKEKIYANLREKYTVVVEPASTES
ncbi:MAG: peptidyl-prolyl cis-trans isomerase [Desulfofustis sp.]|nr:peptidyl-prolyl cis-trans isomerase [Desulfofustis sp.]NNK56620.1 peptidyl-prolyl cis-trans isomerase [Desulfofustis sp.]